MRIIMLVICGLVVSASAQAFVCIPDGQTGVGIPCPNPPIHCPGKIHCISR